MVHFGWDVSTSFIGCCCMREDGTVVLIESIDLSGVTGGILEKFLVAEEKVIDFIRRARAITTNAPEIHCVEQRLKNMVGKTNKDTLLSLASMNAVVSHVIIKECGRNSHSLRYLYPIEVKKIVGLKVPKGADKKALTVDFVRAIFPEFPFVLNRGGVNPVKGTFDMADAFVTALASVRESLEQAKKSVSPDKGARKAGNRKTS